MTRQTPLLSRIVFCVLVISFMVLFRVQDCTGAEQPYELSWVRQIGSSSQENPYDTQVDPSGGIWVVGTTFGSLFCENHGDDTADLFLTKYDSAGNRLSGYQYGSPEQDSGRAIAFDTEGNAYLTGFTTGSFGGPTQGSGDIILSKHDSSGEMIWAKQIGTHENDGGYGIAVNSSDYIFIGGYYESGYSPRKSRVIKCDSSGNVLWKGPIYYENISSVACDTMGHIYAAGEGPRFGDWDAVVMKVDTSGRLQWEHRVGSSESEGANEVVLDARGNVYIAGNTRGDFGGVNAGYSDAYVAKLDSDGRLQWVTQFGTTESEHCESLAIDKYGCTYICGDTRGLLGESNVGQQDIFVTKCDPTGNVLWTRQFGTPEVEAARGICVDDFGAVYVTGYTWGEMGGTNSGEGDMFLAKLSPVPEPSVVISLAFGLACLVFSRRRR